jgi:hypothetical protein
MSTPLILGLCACLQRNRLNTNCEWFDEPKRQLDLRRTFDQNHLRDDARLAEELAVRYGDAARTFRPESLPAVRSRRQECIERLSDGIAARHAVTAVTIRAAALRRSPLVDVIFLFVPMATFLALIAKYLWRRIYAEAGAKSWWALVFMAFASLATSGIVILFGEVWSDIVEMVRVADTHLSMRANRVPWTGHRSSVFVVALLFFWARGWFDGRERALQSSMNHT